MLIYGCKKCDSEEHKYEVLPISAFWNKEIRGESIWLLECKHCGQVYRLSALQCCALYMSLTFVWTIVFLLYDTRSALSSFFALALLGLSFPVPFYVVWNELPWKAVETERPQKEWKAKIVPVFMVILAVVSSYTINFFVCY